MAKNEKLPPSNYKIFCDESCHLLSDGTNVMVFGALRCATPKLEEILRTIKSLREAHNYHTEIKWTKLIRRQLPFYKALIDLFFDTEALSFKAIIVVNKKLLDHEKYNDGSHSNFYYKMAFYCLRDFLGKPNESHQIYFDYMDTQGNKKAQKLKEVLTNRMNGSLSITTQVIRSYESNLIQICDLFAGSLSYINREDIEKNSVIKNEIINYLKVRTRRDLNISTTPWEEKFNIFMFSPRS